jgi:aryl-alcohol dehydrogenase-like predicted oxidoreductase
VGVVGGGNSAGQAAVWLARGGALVTLLHRRADLRETMSDYLVRELERYAERRGWTVAQLAIAWTLATPGVAAAIVGARNPEQIEGTAPAGDVDLSARDREEVEEILEGAVPVGGPSPETV